MTEELCGRTEEGCSDSRLPRPGKPEARSGSHDWHMGWREKESGKCQTLNGDHES